MSIAMNNFNLNHQYAIFLHLYIYIYIFFAKYNLVHPIRKYIYHYQNKQLDLPDITEYKRVIRIYIWNHKRMKDKANALIF